MIRPLLAASLLVALLSGCFGIPEGAADTGDLVTIRYTVEDLATGEAVRSNETASFDVGSGASGLGLVLERALRGHEAGDSFTVTVRDDRSLGFNQRVEVPRALEPIDIVQSASVSEFQQFVGMPAVNVTFPAYGIYTGRVTAVTNTTVTFRVEAEDGQLNDVQAVGSILETRVGDGVLTRRLNPVEGATFTIQPPQPFQPSTPLGLEPGAYQVAGATDEHLILMRSVAEGDLLDRDLRFTVTVVAITPADQPVPTEGNFGVRSSPVVNGDPYAALGEPAPSDGEDDGHDH